MNRLCHSIFVCLFFFAIEARAVPILYDNRADFLAALPADLSLEYEGFEGLAPFGQRVGGGVHDVQFDSVRVTADKPALKVFSRAYNGNKNLTANGKHYLSLDTDLRRRGTEALFHFDERSVRAIGFHLIDHDSSDIEVLGDGFSHRIEKTRDGGTDFFGVIYGGQSESISSISLNTGADSHVSIDDFVLAYRPMYQVDEPSVMSLILCATGCLYLARSRKFHSVL